MSRSSVNHSNTATVRKSYRELDSLNYSAIKLFATNTLKFYEEVVLRKRKKDAKTDDGIVIGDLIDYYVIHCRGNDYLFDQDFDAKFVKVDGGKSTAQVFVLADNLFDICMNNLDDEGKCTLEFSEMFIIAFDKTQKADKYKGKTVEHALKDFEDNGRYYFEKKRENIGKTLVTDEHIAIAKRVGNLVLNDDFSSDLFNKNDNEDLEFLRHYSFEWEYVLGGKNVKCKSELDLVIINHRLKTIEIWDLKSSYDNSEFNYHYIKMMYYLQAAFYHLGVFYHFNVENEMNYKVLPTCFCVADTSKNERRPLKYTLTEQDIQAGIDGFKLNGRFYKGLDTLIGEIEWAKENNEWKISKKDLESNGIRKLNLNYESLD